MAEVRARKPVPKTSEPTRQQEEDKSKTKRSTPSSDVDLEPNFFVVAGMFLVSFGYAGPCNAFISMYPAEIMPTSIRTVGCAVSYTALHLVIILLVQVTPLAVEAISWRYFLIFFICSCCFAVAFYFLYPETKGKTLEDIEAIFGDRVSISLSNLMAILTSDVCIHRLRRPSMRRRRILMRRCKSGMKRVLFDSALR